MCDLLWGEADVPLELLHELLHDDRHQRHQAVVRALQLRRDPTSVAELRRALQRGFDRLAYTCSEHGVIAKWFSHALADIGTPEAIAVLEAFAQSPDDQVAAEMRYRLGRLSP